MGERKARGQSLVEFSLVIPLFLLLLLGLAEGGYYVISSTIVGNATREGARLGVLQSTADQVAIKDRVIAQAGPVVSLAATTAAARAKITVCVNGSGCSDADYQDRVLGDRLTVVTDYVHRPLVAYVFDQIGFEADGKAELMVEGSSGGGSSPTPTPTATAGPTPTPTAGPTPTPGPTPTAGPTPTPTPAPTPGPGTLLALEDFEGTFPPPGWTSTGDVGGEFSQDSTQAHSGTNAAFKAGDGDKLDGVLTSPVLDTSGNASITVDFWWYLDRMDGGRVELQFKNASGVWVDIHNESNKDIGDNFWDDDIWLNSADYAWSTTSDSQFLHADFQFRFNADNIDNSRWIWIDDVQVTGT